MPVPQSPRRTPTGPQLFRLQHILERLREGRPLTTRIAAEAFEVSRRTIANDIEYLRQIGVPLEYDARQGTYVLTEPFGNLPLVAMRRTELAAFIVARYALEALGDLGRADLLQGTTERLAGLLPETVQVEPDTLARTIRIDAGPQPRRTFQNIAELEQAVAEQRVVHLRYYANHRAEETERDVEPYTLLAYQGRWYLIAYCRWRQDMRDFRLDRIRHLALRDEVFGIPPGFDLDDYLGPAFGMHRGERTYAIHVRFSPYQARWIAEERWHESQVMNWRADGSLDVRMQVMGLGDVARWALSYGGACEVISPPVLRHRIAREARQMAALYQHTVTPNPDAHDLSDKTNG